MSAARASKSGPANTTDSATVIAGGANPAETTGKNLRRKVETETHLSAGGALLGYARTSRADQVLDRQIDSLLAEGCARIFEDDGVTRS